MNIIQRFIPANCKDTRPGIKMVPKFITIHETDNTGHRANAEAHARLQESGNSRQASWHVQVDDCQAIQSIPFDEVAWHAGDGNGPGNMSSIAIEICVNCDGDYKKAVSNAAEVTKQLMQQFNIPLSNVVQHNKWSGKNCPSIMRSGCNGITWDGFLAMLKDQPKQNLFFVITGGYSGDSLVNIQKFLMESKFWFEPSRKDSDGTLMFNIGGFFDGTDSAKNMITFLDSNKYWYEKRYK